MALVIRKNRSPKPPPCPIGACMTILGGTWTPAILWNLIGGPRRFGELKHDIPRISAKMLSTRLKDLEARKVISRSLLDTSPPAAEYALTALGHELVPLLRAIAELGGKFRAAQNAGPRDSGAPDPSTAPPLRREHRGSGEPQPIPEKLSGASS